MHTCGLCLTIKHSKKISQSLTTQLRQTPNLQSSFLSFPNIWIQVCASHTQPATEYQKHHARLFLLYIIYTPTLYPAVNITALTGFHLALAHRQARQQTREKRMEEGYWLHWLPQWTVSISWLSPFIHPFLYTACLTSRLQEPLPLPATLHTQHMPYYFQPQHNIESLSILLHICVNNPFQVIKKKCSIMVLHLILPNLNCNKYDTQLIF